MNVDTELASWQRQWQGQPVSDIPQHLRRLVERESRRMRWSLLSPVLATIVVGGIFTAPALRSGEADAIGLAVSVWIIFALTWTFFLWNSAGTWRPEAETTAAFLDVSLRRCHRAIRGAAFGVVLYVGELAFCISWILRHPSGAPRETLSSLVLGWPVGAVVWLVTPAFFAFVFWYLRRRRRELAALEAFRVQWSE